MGDPPAAPGRATHPCAPLPVLTVLRAFPCRTRLGDAEAAGAVEEEVTQPQRWVRGSWGSQGTQTHGVGPSQICQSLFLRGLSLVGWYHSHPFGPALPSLHDIDAQMDYQLKLQGSGNGFQPCLALICGKRPLRGYGGCCHPPPPLRVTLISVPSTPGPYYHGNPGVESKIAPFWVMPPPEVSGCQPHRGGGVFGMGVTPPLLLPHPPATAQ